MYYVYKITNLVNGRFYIGKRKHKTPEKDNYMGSGKLIILAIQKHGIENFKKEIIDIFETNDEAAILEKSLVTLELVNSSECYNMHIGGHGGFEHINNAPIEQRTNIQSLRAKIASGEITCGGDKSAFFTEETIQKLREASKKGNEVLKNRTLEEKLLTSKKQSESSKGKLNSQYGKRAYIDPVTKHKLKVLPKDAPPNYVLFTSYEENRKQNSYRWYNDGKTNFYLKAYDLKIKELNLSKGRLNN